ncbi:MAG: Mitochondrial inner membrane protein oxa1 [Alyxoria varia]|nr:MAG: Mitochondrial inner membrane protein oxa1 [Alyxoria varia]
MPTAAGSFSIETLRTDDAAAIDPDIYSLEEAAPAEIGYLREIYDLDFGWGPTSMMQYVFEHVHVYLGAEYWVSIMLTAAIVRLVIFPLQASAADNTAKMASLTPVTKPIQDRIKWAKEKKDQVEIKRCYTQLRTVWNQADVRVYRGFLPLLQLPLGFGLWRLFRNMGDVGVAGLESGGPLFHIPVLGDLGLENLLEPGPMYIAFLVAGMNFASAKLAGKERTITSDDTMLQAQKFMLYGLPVVSFFITLVQPALVQLFFLNTSFFAISSTWLLQQNRFRAFYGITPRVTPTSQADKQQEEVRKRKKYAGTINVRKDAKTLKAEKQKAEAEEAQKKQRRPLPRSPSIPQKVLFSAGSWVAVFDKLRVRLEDGDLPLFRSRETQEKRREERALKDWAKQREDYERENREKVERGMRERDEEGKRLRREARLRRSRG